MPDQQDTQVPQTFMMRCPSCKKTTQCIKMGKPPKKGLKAKAVGAPHASQFKCLECGTGWSVATGGSFELSSLR